MKLLELGDNICHHYAKFVFAKVLKSGDFLGGRYIFRKGGIVKSRFIKGGVETPLHTMRKERKMA